MISNWNCFFFSFFFDLTQPIVFPAVFFSISWSILVVVCSSTGVDCVFCTLGFLIVGYLEVLQSRAKLMKNAESLKYIVQNHIEIMTNTKQLYVCYSVLLMVQFIYSIIMITFLGYLIVSVRILKFWRFSENIFLILYFLKLDDGLWILHCCIYLAVAFIQLAIYGFIGSLIEEAVSINFKNS